MTDIAVRYRQRIERWVNDDGKLTGESCFKLLLISKKDQPEHFGISVMVSQ